MLKSTTTSETPLPHPIPASDELGPLVGRTFGGYEITSYIGEGPTGAVYRAEDLVGGRMAVKVMHRELSRKPAADQLWADLQKLGGLGTAIDVPLGHKDAAFVRSHFDAVELRIPDAPRGDEIVVAVAVTDSGRPLARVGGLQVSEIKGEDGLR